MANAVRDNPERAEFLGYSSRWVRYNSFVAAGFFAGIAGGLFAINYEILTEENLNLTTSGSILLVTFLGGVGVFFGPVVGAIVFTLLQTVLSLETEIWSLYVGALFVATVMFFPSGLAGVMQMHIVPIKLGKWRLLVMPYIVTLVPAIVCILGLSGLIEVLFHARHAAIGETEMTLFWVTFQHTEIWPWVVFALMAALGFWLARKNAPQLMEAWHKANTPDGADT
jgi:branched-chain amino acid transport system permease protein